MKLFSIFLSVLLSFLVVDGHCPVIKVVPYAARHGHVIVRCMMEHYPSLCSMKKSDPCVQSVEARKQHGINMVNELNQRVNGLGQVISPDQSMTVVKVAEVDDHAVGYVRYITFPRFRGACISQLAVQNQDRGLGYGRILMEQTVKDLRNMPGIDSAMLTTFSRKLGDTFYVPLGFELSEHEITDENYEVCTWNLPLR